MAKLMVSADDVVRRMLPEALEADGRSSCARRLRDLPELRDAGSVWRAMLAVEAVAGKGGGVSEAARLCGDAAVAALRGEGRRFATLVRRAAASLSTARCGRCLN